jgi:hypothetical protein
LMQRADDSWNARNLAAFDSLHAPGCVIQSSAMTSTAAS